MNRSKQASSWVHGVLGACLLVGTVAAPTLAQQQPTGPAASAVATRTLGIDTTNFDRSIRPQDDFFRFANGGWLKRTEIPADRSSYGSFTELADQSEAVLHKIIEEAAASRAHRAGSDLQKVGDLYRSFMDTERIERAGIKPLAPSLAKVRALKSRSELPAYFANLQKEGIQTPFGFGVGQDGKDATRYIGSLSQGGLGLPDRDYYLKNDAKFVETRAAYQKYIETLLSLAGEKYPAQAAKNVVAFETALAEKHWDRARSRDRELTYNLKSVAELDQLTPGFSWSAFLKTAGAEKTPGVVVRQVDYLPALNEILARTPVETIRQYETFKLLDSSAPYLSSPFAKAQFEFRGKALAGQQAERERWKRGVSVVESALGEVVGRLYVEQTFKPEQKARMQTLVDNVIAAFREGIDQLEWMSPETKAQAHAKLAKFNVKIGYPDRWEDYSALSIDPTDVIGNLRRARQVRWTKMVGRLGKPIDRDQWGMTPQTVNAYYSSTMNEIVFPAAILQPPFFDPAADDATNYGAIGGVIGHEISHGFDDQGRRSDGDGNLRDWWTEADNAAFQKRTAMLDAQYSSFSPIPGMFVNGKLTMGENIGDLSGLAVAYKAYQRSLGGQPAPVIDGFTGDQRFFLGWAQVWRRTNREEALRNQLLSDPHSPAEYRVNGVMRNLPEFYAAFGVKPGDGMYLEPEQRVKLW